jgi:hypothetical protein
MSWDWGLEMLILNSMERGCGGAIERMVYFAHVYAYCLAGWTDFSGGLEDIEASTAA